MKLHQTANGRCVESGKPLNKAGYCPDSDGPKWSRGCYLMPHSKRKAKKEKK